MSNWFEFFTWVEMYFVFLWNLTIWGIPFFPILVVGTVISIIFKTVSMQAREGD